MPANSADVGSTFSVIRPKTAFSCVGAKRWRPEFPADFQPAYYAGCGYRKPSLPHTPGDPPGSSCLLLSSVNREPASALDTHTRYPRYQLAESIYIPVSTLRATRLSRSLALFVSLFKKIPIRVRFHIIGNVRIKNVCKYQSSRMFSK